MEKRYDLTFPQENIWLVNKLYNSSKTNLITGIININKGFKEINCAKAVNLVIKNNDALRIKIKVENNNPYQIIEEYVYQDIKIIDMQNFDDLKKEEYIGEYKKRDIDILNDKLFEFSVLKYSNDSGAVLLKMHHIVSDAWSYSKIVEQFIKYYNNIENSEEVEEGVTPGYTEYINSTMEYKISEKYAKDSTFWNEYLEGYNDDISLKSKTKNISNTCKRYNVKLDKKINDDIKEYCKIHRTSPYVLFLAAFSTYIYRIKDKNDIVIGTPTLNRANFKEKQMLGMFVSTLPLRIKLNESETFLNLVQEIGRNTMGIFRHQKFPYTEIVKNAHDKNNNISKLFSILLSYQNARVEYEDIEKYDTKWYANDFQNEDLQIHMLDMDSTGILEINYDYLDEIFEDVEIEYLHTRLLAILKHAIEDESIDIENINIMSEEEKNVILNDFNNTKMEYQKDKSIIDLFEEQVEKTPQSIALVFEDKKVTYKELNEMSNSVAHFLIENEKIKSGDIVGIKLNRSVELISAILGVAKTGATYLPIDPTFPKDRIEYIKNNSKAKIIIDNLDKIDYTRTENVKFDFDINSPFYVLYTSGSTGKPKGVMITCKNMLNFVYGINKIISINEKNNVLSITTVSFDIFELELWLPLLNGAKIILANDEEKYNPYLLNKLCLKNSVDVMQTTPSVYMSLLTDENNVLFFKNLDKVILGGEKITYNLLNKLRNVTDAKLYDGYGPTETTIYSSMKLLDKKISVGLPVPNTQILIKDKKSRTLPLGVPGELYISGDGLTAGYLFNKDLTSKNYVNVENKIWYKTGDLGLINYDIEANILDRVDFQIKINGQRVEVEEIEKNIYETNLVKECAVVLNNNKLLCVYNGKGSKEDIISIISKSLPRYMVPKLYYYMENIPKTANGKLDRKKLQNINIKKDKNKKIMPSTSIQKYISDSINEILTDSLEIDINTSFFEIGLDSLDIIRLCSMINDKFEIEITYSDIVEYDNISMLEKLIENKEKKILKENVDLNITGRYKLSSIQRAIYTEYFKNKESIMYNIPFEISVDDSIDKAKLRECIEKTIYNHKILFSTFVEEKTIIYGKIKENIEFNFDFTKVTEEKYQSIKEKFVKPFELNKELFRIDGYEVDNKLKILFDFCHIVVDGYSVRIILDQIQNMYNKNFEYKEENNFVQRKNNVFSDENREYFLEKYKNKIIETKIAPDFDLKNSNKGNKIGIKYDKLDILKEYCKQNNITLNILVLSTFLLVLKNINVNKTDDVIIGISNIGRMITEYEETVGMFVKNIPCKVEIKKEMAIKEFLNRVKIEYSDLIKNRNYTYEDLIIDLNEEEYIPSFLNILYTFQEKGLPNMKFGGKNCDILELKTNTSKFDINLEVIENTNNSLTLNIEYRSKYIESTIKHILDLIINTLEYILNNNLNLDLKVNEVLTYISNNNFSYINNKNDNKSINSINSIKSKKISQKTLNSNNEIILKILNIYRNVLNNNNFSIYDDFFEFGGDSLMLMRILSELTNSNIDVKYSDLFKYKTVYDLCKYIDNATSDAKNRIIKEEMLDINNLLKYRNETIHNVERQNVKNVILVGVTGFLGIYLLKSLCFNKNIEKVYCIVREKGKVNAKKRLNELLKFYFDEKDINEILNKVIIIEANITEPKCIEKKLSMEDIEKVDVVINAAARVKHFGEEDPFVEINVNAVNYLIDFCLKYDKELIHISTLSVSGNFIEGKQTIQTKLKNNVIYDESCFYIGQEIDNIYVYTKYIAEKNIYNSILKDNLKAKVIRIGNLTSSYSSGKFQINVSDNAFVQRIKSMINLKIIPDNLKDFYFEFTPVDYAADAIIKLAMVKTLNNVFHIYNPNHVSMNKMIDYLKTRNIDIEIVSKEEFKEVFKHCLKNNYEMVEGIVIDINDNFEIEYVDNIKIKNDKTIKILQNLNYKWPNIDEVYLNKFISYLIDIGFLNIGGDK